MWATLASIAPTLIPLLIIYFNVIGQFGNVNVIIATVRKKSLHTKHGVLLALLSFYQSLCLVFELVNAAVGLHGVPVQRHTCFMMMIPYVIFCCMQSTMYLVLALDILFSIVFPLRVLVARLWVYVGIASILPVFYAAFIISLNFFEISQNQDNPTIRLCNPAFSLEPLVKDIWLNWNGFSNIGVLIVHISINFVLKPNDKRNRELGRVVMHSEQKRVCLCMMWLTIAFVSTWGTCMLSQCIVTWMEPSLATKVVHAYSAIFAMMAYSMNYYVYIIRNEKYRRAFLEQLSCVLPERLHPLPSISSRGALSSNPTFVRNSSHGSRPPSFHSHYQQRHEAGDSRASSHSHHQYYDNHGANLSSKPSIHSLHAKYRHSNRREPQHSRDTSVAQEDVKELSGP